MSRGFRLVRPGRLELPPGIPRTRPSTLRVYQFRHRRVAGANYSGGNRLGKLRLKTSEALCTLRKHVRISAHNRGSEGGQMVEVSLTKRQQEIFDFIKRYSAKHGYPPTVRDIGKAIGLTSSSTVHAHLANLEKLGLLRRDPTKPRALEVLVDTARKAVAPSGLPLVGRVAAGAPVLADENIEEYVDVPNIAGGGEGEFVLRVDGDSMK